MVSAPLDLYTPLQSFFGEHNAVHDRLNQKKDYLHNHRYSGTLPQTPQVHFVNDSNTGNPVTLIRTANPGKTFSVCAVYNPNVSRFRIYGFDDVWFIDIEIYRIYYYYITPMYENLCN